MSTGDPSPDPSHSPTLHVRSVPLPRTSSRKNPWGHGVEGDTGTSEDGRGRGPPTVESRTLGSDGRGDV